MSRVTSVLPPGGVGIGSAMFHISAGDPARLERCLPEIRRIASVGRLTLHYRDDEEVSGRE